MARTWTQLRTLGATLIGAEVAVDADALRLFSPARTALSLCQKILCRSDVSIDGVSADAGPLAPFANRDLLSVKNEESRGPPIDGLILRGSPVHIFRRIRTVVISALKRVSSGGAEANVRYQALHPGHSTLAVNPSIADRHPPSAVSMKCLVLPVRAARDGGLEALILDGFGQPVRDRCCGNRLGSLATARDLKAASKVAPKNINSRPAIAIACPNRLPVSIPPLHGDHSESAKSLSREVDTVVRSHAYSPVSVRLNTNYIIISTKSMAGN